MPSLDTAVDGTVHEFVPAMTPLLPQLEHEPLTFDQQPEADDALNRRGTGGQKKTKPKIIILFPSSVSVDGRHCAAGSDGRDSAGGEQHAATTRRPCPCHSQSRRRVINKNKK